MPMVKVHYQPNKVGSPTAKALGDCMAGIVARALTCNDPEGELTDSDVEVDVAEMSPKMQTRYDLHIEVEANDYPDRRKDLDQRAQRVAEQVRIFFNQRAPWQPSYLPKGWVWVKLVPAAWVEL